MLVVPDDDVLLTRMCFLSEHDLALINKYRKPANDPVSWLDTLMVYCAMRLSARYYGATNRYGTISLASAASQADLNGSGQAHSALADAAMTTGVVSVVARYWSQQQREMRDDTGE